MSHFKYFIAFSSLLILSGCGTVATQTNSVSTASLSDCGEFTESSDGHAGTNRYSVCKTSETESCYFKQVQFTDKEDCEYDEEKFPYGTPECYLEIVTNIDSEGEPISEDSIAEADTCTSIDEPSFESLTSN